MTAYLRSGIARSARLTRAAGLPRYLRKTESSSRANTTARRRSHGLVCAYETEGEYIAFTGITMFPGFGAKYADWVFGAYASSHSIYYGQAYAGTSDSVFFVRYGATSWRLFSGEDAIKADGYVSTGGYVYSVDGNNIEFMMICGACGEQGGLPPATAKQSCIFDDSGAGWDDGDIQVTITQ